MPTQKRPLDGGPPCLLRARERATPLPHQLGNGELPTSGRSRLSTRQRQRWFCGGSGRNIVLELDLTGPILDIVRISRTLPLPRTSDERRPAPTLDITFGMLASTRAVAERRR